MKFIPNKRLRAIIDTPDGTFRATEVEWNALRARFPALPTWRELLTLPYVHTVVE